MRYKSAVDGALNRQRSLRKICYVILGARFGKNRGCEERVRAKENQVEGVRECFVVELFCFAHQMFWKAGPERE